MIRTAVARSLVVATMVAAGFGVAGTAFAEPNTNGANTNDDSGGMGACPVVDSDDSGNESTTYVPHGTKLMGLTCQDGIWVYVKSVKGAGAGAVARR